VVHLKEPLEYSLAVDARTESGIAKVTCRKTVRADVELRIRHGTTLLLRDVVWVVSEQHAQHVLISRPLLEGLRLDTRKILEDAVDKHNGIVNFPDLLVQEASRKGTLAKLMMDNSIFHSAVAEDGVQDDDDIYIDLGEDTEQELNEAL